MEGKKPPNRCAASPRWLEKNSVVVFVVVVVLLIGSMIRLESVLIGRGCSEIPGRNQKPAADAQTPVNSAHSRSLIAGGTNKRKPAFLSFSLLRDDMMSKTLFSTI